MANYLARYRTEAGIFDGGCFMDDPEPHLNEYRFSAGNDKEAKKKAEDHIPDIKLKYFGVRSCTLESLMQIKDLKLLD